tara:strand:+ start:318 stop:584 length:267 start_codon:yes stop_codon:yes gene_type:complete
MARNSKLNKGKHWIGFSYNSPAYDVAIDAIEEINDMIIPHGLFIEITDIENSEFDHKVDLELHKAIPKVADKTNNKFIKLFNRLFRRG